MWIRKTPAEIKSKNQFDLIRVCGWTALLGAAFDCVLVHLQTATGPEWLRSPLERWAVALVAAFLPVWFFSNKARRYLRSTVVCERCNTVKPNGGETTCKCGGKFLTLLEAKWMPGENQPPAAAREDNLMAQRAP